MVIRGNGASSGDDESRAFYQARLALFARVLAILGLGFLVLVLVAEATVAGMDELFAEVSTRFRVLHVALIALYTGIWIFTRTGPRSRRVLEAIDVGGNLLAYAMVALTVSRPHVGLERTMALLLTELLMTRAVLVPSAASRSAALGVIAIAISVITTWAVYATSGPFDARAWAAMIDAFGWPAFSTVVATVASHTIYGLRAEVRQARRLGQYVLEAKLGEGGMGVVYRAQHALLRRPTAIKLLPPERVGAEMLARFEREVRQTARLTHPNTVQIYDYGRTPDGIFYYAMEYLPGCDLELVVNETGAMPPARVVHVVAQIASALAEAHELGLVHRDVKPANVILTTRAGEHDVAKVVDFGLVKDLARDPAGSMTHDATIRGTPLYLAPETIGTGDVAPASDLYSLGALAYFLLTGTHVFRGHNVVEICAHHLHTPPEPPSARLGAALPEGLDALVLQCLAKKPGERPASARALRASLRALRIEPWSDEDAARFWTEHGPALEDARAHRAQHAPPSSRDRSVAIDLDRRT
ncbi:serine/threonine-protein kinase [Sandaracinus amylolyticus]|uniref:Serine/threonine kinase n=1 Tax=Sandaracinus amylolyticus TaxID=927083 RepID=A0A0F6YKU4_9BACT|nr:serine/threonine-protein kinase [Sandaracinus amylolyticus]AKF09595.1 serine/threonine kinase [Sandaracinus amylolyticus]